MAKFIDKDSVLVEIDERIKSWKEYYDDMYDAGCYDLAAGAYLRMYELKDFKEFLDTLDVKDMDLEKEMHECILKLHTAPCWEELVDFAKHFFELGLNAKQK